VSRPRLVFRKRVKLFGPLYLNASLHHIGLGVHVPGASFSINDSGRRQASIGIPGSGMRVQQVWAGKTSGGAMSQSSRSPRMVSTPRLSWWPLVMAVVMFIALLLAALR
jgi:hypothetical protein